jgi:hypothetical protein
MFPSHILCSLTASRRQPFAHLQKLKSSPTLQSLDSRLPRKRVLALPSLPSCTTRRGSCFSHAYTPQRSSPGYAANFINVCNPWLSTSCTQACSHSAKCPRGWSRKHVAIMFGVNTRGSFTLKVHAVHINFRYQTWSVRGEQGGETNTSQFLPPIRFIVTFFTISLRS